MHHLMLVTLAMADDATSEDTRRRVFNLLAGDHSFCGEGGRFGTPLSDWFVIGGRWSGMLHEQLLGQDYRDVLHREFPEFAKDSFPHNLVAKHRAGLDQLWRRFGGTGGHPITRSGYDELGDDDDAMSINAALYERFLKEYRGFETADDNHFADLDGDPVEESFIGRKWLIVIDYHN